jgi:prevent-host-death family protein
MAKREKARVAARTTAGAAGRPAEVAASDVKNGWHEYLDRVSRGGEEIVITRYGKPIARLAPMEPAPTERPFFGSMAGTVTIHGDLVEPIDVVWEANA